MAVIRGTICAIVIIASLGASLLAILLMVVLLLRLWLRGGRGIFFKLFFSWILGIVICLLGLISINLKDSITLAPLQPPTGKAGGALSLEATEEYLELISHHSIPEEKFHRAVRKLIEAGSFATPIHRPDILIGAGIEGKVLPKDEEYDYSLPVGNVREALQREIDSIRAEVDLDPSNAVSRIFLLLGLANLYIETEKMYESFAGIDILEGVLPALERHPELSDNQYIQGQLKRSARLREHYIRARKNSIQMAIYVLEKEMDDDLVSHFIYNRTIMREHINLKNFAHSDEEQEAIMSFKVRVMRSLQIPTIIPNYRLGLNADLENNPENVGVNELQKRIEVLLR
jgi:hypothetical protein